MEHAEAVQDMDRKLLARLGRQVAERGPRRVARERLHLRLMVGRVRRVAWTPSPGWVAGESMS